MMSLTCSLQIKGMMSFSSVTFVGLGCLLDRRFSTQVLNRMPQLKKFFTTLNFLECTVRDVKDILDKASLTMEPL